MLNSNQQHEQHDEEEQEQEEEEEDEFHESLDRLLSSASSSTSDDDADSFPPFSADLWNSSIQDRRRRLLMHFGLSPDPSRSDSNPDPKPIPKPKPPCTNLHNQRSFHRHRPSLGLPPISRPPEFARHRSTSVTAIDFEDAVTIKNLDNGTEFIVKEVREDGTWKKLREVETGRQLSMEEFELSVGTSPIVQELMRRQNKEDQQDEQLSRSSSSGSSNVSSKKRGGWLSFRNSFKKSQQEGEMHGVARAKVGKCGKSEKDLSGLVMSQQIKAHSGAIWSVKFSLDGKHLASAGEDCVIHVWKVNESEKKEGLDRNRFLSSPDLVLGKGCGDEGYWERRRRMKVVGRRSLSSADQLMVPEYVFGLSEEPVCSFRGHGDDVLDLSWSKSQYLLSSSMDKTVRLWHLSSKSCLKTFSHSDYVTCIQFNPVDDRYFISGSLDEKVRLWSIPDRQIVDWNDLHEMITAACYSPDGQTALVGSHKGSCHLYNTSENKLLRKSQIDLKNKKKKSSPKKITGFQFAPGKSSEVIITSADSRIRFIDGVELVHKFKGFRNTSSQISACFTANGKFVICASEDSRVYVWRYEPRDSRSNRSKGSISVTQSYEHFHCQDVTVAVPWPGTSTDRISVGHHAPSFPPYGSNVIINTHNSHFSDKLAATWPEEKLLISARNYLPQGSGDIVLQSRPAWGMVIVAAGRGGEIRTFQNFGFPI